MLKSTFYLGLSTDRKFSNSIDFTNSNHIKNKLSTANYLKKMNNESNYICNTKGNESEYEIKNMIQNELANSLVKENMACPLSPQARKSNLLNNYV